MEALGFALMETQLGEPVVLDRGKKICEVRNMNLNDGVIEVCKPPSKYGLDP